MCSSDLFPSHDRRVTAVILDLYLVYSSFVAEAQGLESIASLACASFIPEKLFSIIRKSQYLSSVEHLPCC